MFRTVAEKLICGAEEALPFNLPPIAAPSVPEFHAVEGAAGGDVSNERTNDFG